MIHPLMPGWEGGMKVRKEWITRDGRGRKCAPGPNSVTQRPRTSPSPFPKYVRGRLSLTMAS